MITIALGSPSSHRTRLLQGPPCTSDYCGYVVAYDSNTNTIDHLVQDTLPFGTIVVPDMVFGCSKRRSW